MSSTYRVHFSIGDDQLFNCDIYHLRKKVAEKLNNIPMDQIVLVDKDNKLFDLNKTLTQTQLLNPNTEQQYKQLDLQKLINEWSQMKIDNDQYQKIIEANNNKINELNKKIEIHNQESQKNLSDREITNSTLNSLRDDLQKLNKSSSEEILRLQNNIKDLNSQLSQEANSFEQQKQQFLFQLGDLNEKYKSAENKIQQQSVQIQQLKAQIQEKDNTINNITQQQNGLCNQFQQWQQGLQNYQLQVAQQTQEYQTSINTLTEDKESLDKKLKAEKIKTQQSTNQINELETQLSTKEASIKKQETLIKKLQQQIEDNKKEQESLELERQKATQQGYNVNNEAQRLRQELQKQKNDYAQLQFEREQLQNELDNFKSQHELFAKQAQNTLQATNQEHEEAVQTQNNKINQLINEINNLKKQYSDAQYQIKDREAKIEHANQEYQKLQQHLDQLNSTGNSLGQLKRTLEQTTQQLQDELTEARRQCEAEKAKYRTAENEKTQLKGQLQQKEIELTNEQTNHDNTKREKNLFQDQCQKMAVQFKELQQQTTNEAQRLTTQVQVAERKIDRVLQNFGETKLLEKITGPLEKIMASEFKINRFTDDPNSQSDNAQYNLIEITLQFDKYTQYVKEGKFFLIDECFQFGNKINITATRSIQANAESEFYKGYLIRIVESAQADLKTKALLRKDLKLQNLAFQNKEEAARLAVNNIFCQWLQMQFNKDLGIAKLQPLNRTIQRQFIIENEAKKEYYYCEMVEEGPFQKINGGKFVPQKDDIHQYFNGLSSYSYKMFEQQLILTNFQVCGNYVYDMIVHTNHKGLFSPLDQGPPEAITFLDIVTKQPADIMSKSWNDTVRNQAEKYLRQ